MRRDMARVVITEVNPEIPWTHGSRHLTEADIGILMGGERLRVFGDIPPHGRSNPAASKAGIDPSTYLPLAAACSYSVETKRP